MEGSRSPSLYLNVIPNIRHDVFEDQNEIIRLCQRKLSHKDSNKAVSSSVRIFDYSSCKSQFYIKHDSFLFNHDCKKW